MQYSYFQQPTFPQYQAVYLSQLVMRDTDNVSAFTKGTYQQSTRDELNDQNEALVQKQHNLTSEQLKAIQAEVHFLITSWLDDYERQIFKGSPLQEFLHEKGGL